MQIIDPDDIRLAVESRLNHHHAQVPSREVLQSCGEVVEYYELLIYLSVQFKLMMELAEKRNSIPLPPISNEYGVRLPPMQYQLVTQESERQDQPVRTFHVSFAKLTFISNEFLFKENAIYPPWWERIRFSKSGKRHSSFGSSFCSVGLVFPPTATPPSGRQSKQENCAGCDSN